MIDTNLFHNPTALQRDVHAPLRWASEVPDYAAAAGSHAVFLTVVEMADACLDYPIVFSAAGKGDDGVDDYAPMAVLGLQAGENLMLDGDRWLAHYVPATMRAYPLGLARQDEQSYFLCIDPASKRLSSTEGVPLFENGEPSKFLEDMRQYLEQLEIEVERTRLVGRRLMALGLLRAMRFEAKLPDGTDVQVDGFLVVDETKLASLSDELAGELTRSGLMKALQAQLLSMTHMARLVERRWERRRTA